MYSGKDKGGSTSDPYYLEPVPKFTSESYDRIAGRLHDDYRPTARFGSKRAAGQYKRLLYPALNHIRCESLRRRVAT